MEKNKSNMSQNTANTNGALLKVEELKTYFAVKKGLLQRTVGYVRAVDGVSFEVAQGQSLGLVGESGCGKTTTARSIIRLVPATSGRITFGETDILSANKRQLREIHRQISLIFQDPYSSLNPRLTVGDIIGEPLKYQKGVGGKELTAKIAELLTKVGLSPEHINRYPHEFSGGQRQRIGVARALTTGPRLVICDEPVSALDVSIQSQILNLLKDLQEELGLTYLFIAHDLAVVEFFCDVIAVMYMGRIVEQATSEELYKNPLHPYTRVLMSAIPQVGAGRGGKKEGLGGEVPDMSQIPQGCPFHPRCSVADSDCLKQMPGLKEVGEGQRHLVSCWKC